MPLCNRYSQCVLIKLPRHVDMKSAYIGTVGPFLIWKINIFKKKDVVVFGEVPCSEMGTIKWHMLDHRCYNIYWHVILHINECGPVDHSDQLIKRLCGQTSKRRQVQFRKSFFVSNLNETRFYPTNLGRIRKEWARRTIWGVQGRGKL